MDNRSTKVKKEHAAFFDTLTEKEIRRRQDLCNQQIAIAHKGKMDKALDKLRVMEQDLMEAMLRRC